MQRPKVIRSLGMHIARASHGLLLSLSLVCLQPDSQKQTEKASDLKPVVKGPLCRARSVRVLFHCSAPPPSSTSSSSSSRYAERTSLSYGALQMQIDCKSIRGLAAILVRFLTIFSIDNFGKSSEPSEVLVNRIAGNTSRVLHPCLAYATKLCKGPNHVQG